jgi:hypothetical protein
MPALYVWFFCQKQVTWRQLRDGAVVNCLLSYASPPYCHVELAFEDGKAVTVLKNNHVALRRREFNRLHYNCLKLNVTREVEVHAKSEAMRWINEKFSIFPPCVYCSKLVWEILLNSRAVPSSEKTAWNNAWYITPSELFRRLLSLNAKELDCFDMPCALVIDFKSEFVI